METTKNATISEKQFQLLADYMPQIVWITSPEGNLEYCNKRWEEYTGISFTQTSAGEWLSTIHPDDLQAMLDAWNAALRDISTYEIEARFRRANDNEFRWHLIRGFPIKNESGKLMNWFGTSTDIHDVKKIQESLQEVTEHLTLALESGSAGVWSWDVVTDKVAWSENVYKLFGINDNRLVEKYEDYSDLVHPKDREHVILEITKVLQKIKPMFECDYRVIWPDDSIHLLSSRAQVYTNTINNCTKMIGVVFDITEHSRMEKLIQYNQLEVAKATRASSVSEIASTLAHELNQPLAAINTFIQGSISQLENNNLEELSYALKAAEIQSKRAGEIIHRIKNLVKKKCLHVESTDFTKIVEESIRFIKYEKNNHDIQIRFSADTNIPLLLMDKIQIQQVIINLLHNSIEALEQDQPEIDINCFITKDNLLKIIIKDNGPGFPQEILSGERMGSSTKQDGMGIGLFICQSIINAHGGQLTLHNMDDKGAEVIFTIPVVKEELSCPII